MESGLPASAVKMAAALAAASQQHFVNAAIRAAATGNFGHANNMAPPPSNFAQNERGGGGGSGSRSSNSPLSIQLEYSPETAQSKLVDYRGEKVAAFEINNETMMCLPQAYELFLKSLVGGLHTVYTKLKRLEITPYVCHVEQVRALRSIGAIQPGVNRCKLIACRDFDLLFEDCASSSSRPGRPPKRSPIFGPASLSATNVLSPGAQALGTVSNSSGGVNNFATVPFNGTNVSEPDYNSPAKRGRFSVDATGNFDKVNPMATFMNANSALNPHHIFPLFPFVNNQLVMSQIMSANQGSVLAKQWGEQMNALSLSLSHNQQHHTNNSNQSTNTTTNLCKKEEDDESGNVNSRDMATSRNEANVSKASNGSQDEALNLHSTAVQFDADSIKTCSKINGGKNRNGISASFSREENGPETALNFSLRRDETADDNESNSDFDASDEPQFDADHHEQPWNNPTALDSGANSDASQFLRSMVDMGVTAMGNPLFGGAAAAMAAAAAAAAQAAIPQNGTQNLNFGPDALAESPNFSSVENILLGVAGMLQMAASTSRKNEERLLKEKADAIKAYETEKSDRARLEQERNRLEKLLRAEQRLKSIYKLRLQRGRNQKSRFQERPVSFDERHKQHNSTQALTLAKTKNHLWSNHASGKRTLAAFLDHAKTMVSNVGVAKATDDSSMYGRHGFDNVKQRLSSACLDFSTSNAEVQNYGKTMANGAKYDGLS